METASSFEKLSSSDYPPLPVLTSCCCSLECQAISPGYVETEFIYVASHGSQESAKSVYSSMKCIQPRDIAETVVYILSTPGHVQVIIAFSVKF
jgi:short-subunit dehydrogenase